MYTPKNTRTHTHTHTHTRTHTHTHTHMYIYCYRTGRSRHPALGWNIVLTLDVTDQSTRGALEKLLMEADTVTALVAAMAKQCCNYGRRLVKAKRKNQVNTHTPNHTPTLPPSTVSLSFSFFFAHQCEK